MKLLYVSVLMFLTLKLFSQNSYSELPNLISPSPDAYSIGKYGQIPVGLFTGTVQYDIPLYEIKLKGMSIPISLNYCSNGIRVDEMPSSVDLAGI